MLSVTCCFMAFKACVDTYAVALQLYFLNCGHAHPCAWCSLFANAGDKFFAIDVF